MKKDDVSSGKAKKERYQHDQLRIESGLNNKEEYAAEITAPVRKITYADQYRSAKTKETASRTQEVGDEEVAELVDSVRSNKAVGYIALFVALASLFVWPVLLGISGMILGVIAFFFGNRALGSWSIALGLVAVAAYFLLVPYYA
ncbi:hypothetical protein [Paenibacillus sedimenti]|uniref:DUF4190 domain-containing protein n=1 Tax=Paenibacillus sedimenti TaxID=2770274 RepID=A0A926KLS2_9BACL|nr:hypothetical protein [Paenibacillus sedimenti]MBD0379131.1 hypothetical protein [Paenibacillus sedimenti]